jgi:hypothetical protein
MGEARADAASPCHMESMMWSKAVAHYITQQFTQFYKRAVGMLHVALCSVQPQRQCRLQEQQQSFIHCSM